MNTADKKNKLVILSTNVSMIVALAIVISKIVAWFYTTSPTILASLADSSLDVLTSFVNFLAARYAIQPPDNEHRFGHGKAEDIAVFTQASFFATSGIFVGFISVNRIINPMPLEHGNIGIMAMIFSTIMTFFLVTYQSYVLSKTKSNIVKADRLHFMVDLLSNIAVIVSLFLATYFDNRYIDPIFALGISAYIFYGAIKLLIRAFRNLMDHEMDKKDKKKIINILKSSKKIRGFHDLKTRYSGRRAVIQIHIEMDGEMTLYEAHDVSEEIESKIRKVFHDADVIIHQDPCEIDEEVEFVS